MGTTEWIQKLKVADLKEELKKRGQPIAGKKAELISRLEDCLKNEASPIEVTNPDNEPAQPASAQKSDVEDAAVPMEAADQGPVDAAPEGTAMEQHAPCSERSGLHAAEDAPAPAALQTVTVDLLDKEPVQPQDAPSAAAKLPAPNGTHAAAAAQAKGPVQARPTGALTMADISKDGLMRLADATWSAAALASGAGPTLDPALVERIYAEELGGGGPPAARRVALLELSGYLENYLWPNLDPEAATPVHVLSIIAMVNEKFREGVPAWACFESRQDVFPAFFARLLTLRGDAVRTPHERLSYLTFFINAFQSLENKMVAPQVLRLVSLPLWHALSPGRLQLELHAQPQLAKLWKQRAKKQAKAATAAPEVYVPPHQRPENTFLPSMVADFLERLAAVAPEGSSDADAAAVQYCERFVELLTDLLSQLPTRRFTHAVFEDKAVLVKCYMSRLYRHPAGRLFAQLLDLFRFYASFPIDAHTGDALSEEAVTAAHYERVQQLQRLFFKHVPRLRDLALANCGTVEKREVLKKELARLTLAELKFLVTRQLRLVDEADPWAEEPAFLAEVMLAAYERRRPQREVINEMPLYPTEAVLLDEGQVPSLHYACDGPLALPKLNLQFLTLPDYLLRNFHLFRLEAAYEVREDVADVLRRVAPYLGDDDATRFGGWARMAQPLESFAVVEVRKPRVGENRPAAVTADVVIDTRHMRPDIRAEWDQLKEHDVLFLLTVRPHDDASTMRARLQKGGELNAMQAAGLQYVRGCEVIEIKDEDGKLMNDFSGRTRPDEKQPPRGTVRTLAVALDTAQYQLDMNALAAAGGSGGEDVYSTFSLIMRRKAQENNFKAVLESIRDMVADEEATAAIPVWLHDVLLGYGDPGAAQYQRMGADALLQTVDFKDTFLDATHVREAFPDHDVEFVGDREPQRPFRITFPPLAAPEEDEAPARAKRKAGVDDAPKAASPMQSRPKLRVEPYDPVNPGPYPQDVPPQNTVRFTPVQTSAILSGVQPGLTTVVGPPGTGKTDTAVQIMHILYHNCPNQRTLVITHSNQALNDLFAKITERDVPARYLLRLGMGEAELNTELEFSRVGRVNAMLARRLELLAEVERLARLLKVGESVAYTCETAGHFWLLHVLSRWEKFVAAAAAQQTPTCVQELFPFTEFFADAPPPLFLGRGYAEDAARAQGCFRHLRTMFQELEEIRPFEILKSHGDRVNYLLMKQAKIVAMTCTHAALKRREFLELGFKYDNLLMEEAAQVLEVETTLPMLLQRAEDGRSRLKRIILIGDHHQLPPVVKNVALQKYSHLDQSLFTRFIRLGTPYIELNAQGRARPSLAKLYNWRYRALGDLPRVQTDPAFVAANAGFAFEHQLVDVPDFNGRGESEPVQYFYQNLGEAEYLVSVYQYMRLLGYPAQKISVLTTYNGQRALLTDVVERRCAAHPLFGRPAMITTVDKYQGQQNDYVLLSLVRTRHFGHLRDVRRLVVAMSRARLGLYVFARAGLFANCYELQPTFRQLLARPIKLALAPGEQYGAVQRPASVVPAEALLVEGVEHMASIVGQMGTEWAAAMARAHAPPPPQLMQQQVEQPYPAPEDGAPAEEAAEVPAKQAANHDDADAAVAMQE